ncbi:hypothetical protein C8J57DRAFT_298679 [Mycena rebaudengoi]|nr:hypothetical protein C8J57DRAFT_298679 [Mycena rebaudengoi]
MTDSGTLNRVPEEGEYRVYGDTESGDDEDADWELEEELELREQGLYRGSYKRLRALYTLTPVTTILVFILLAVLPGVAYPHPTTPPSSYPYAALLPYPLPELLLPTALYALTYLLRDPIYSLFSLLLPSFPLTTSLLSTTLHTLLATVARLLCLSLLLIRPSHVSTDDPAFARVWWAAIGWSAAEAVASIYQGYAGLALYRDVLVSPTSASLSFDSPSDPESAPLLRADLRVPESNPDAEIEHDIEQIIAVRAREELEDVFGVPLIHIPPFIPCLQRINALLLWIGVFLLLGAALAVDSPPPGAPSTYPDLQHAILMNPTSTSLSLALSSLKLSILLTHPYLILLGTLPPLLLALLRAPGVLARVGPQGAVYVGAVVSVGMLFGGLGVWGGVS